MLEVHTAPDGFMVYDTEACEAVIKFASRAEADEMIASLQIADVHAKLQQFTTVEHGMAMSHTWTSAPWRVFAGREGRMSSSPSLLGVLVRQPAAMKFSRY
ncbi:MULTISPECIES: hypothetical protein [Rhodanobacter]|uniref:hypothetical protein n=1 Tax=Rhodanobacter TaxID=75309 RepID=UPI000487D433|nr:MULTISPECIES: hypothetical protein [Rhodanobacter]TAN18787.1 MAG: hypothetical protein EPN35_03155 [Rhodanobacter sp.]UJJ55018.1 hypothetical protein LRK53_01015 [Rhodanobacter thiooxydans]